MTLTPGQRESVRRLTSYLASGDFGTEEVACYCGSDEHREIATEDRHGIPSRTVCCARCGLVFVTPRMDEAALRRFYREEYYALYAADRYPSPDDLFEVQRRQGEEIAARLAARGLGEPGRVFDIGCGTGGMLCAFRSRGWDVRGVDLSEDLIACASRSLGDRVRPGGVEALEGEEPADLITVVHLIEHVRDLRAFLGSIQPLLKERGALYIVTPGLRSRAVRAAGFRPFQLNMHLYYFTLGTLSMVLRGEGFASVWGDEGIEALFLHDPDGEEPSNVGDPALGGYLRRVERWRPLWRWRAVAGAWMRRVLG